MEIKDIRNEIDRLESQLSEKKSLLRKEFIEKELKEKYHAEDITCANCKYSFCKPEKDCSHSISSLSCCYNNRFMFSVCELWEPDDDFSNYIKSFDIKNIKDIMDNIDDMFYTMYGNVDIINDKKYQEKTIKIIKILLGD